MTKIQWTNKSWNPVTGCTPVSEGCKNCYAERMANRLKSNPAAGGKYSRGFDVTIHPQELDKPYTWKKPQKIFVCSMGDLFHEDVPFHFIDRVFATMAQNPQHTFQVLTKRPRRMLAYFHLKEFCNISNRVAFLPHRIINYIESKQPGKVRSFIRELLLPDKGRSFVIREWPLPNVWLGVTAETQQAANTRIPLLMKVPAAIKFVSIEPMLEEINLHRFLFDTPYVPPLAIKRKKETSPDWIIVGGETGPGARPLSKEWVKLLNYHCTVAGVPMFFKSSGDNNKFSCNDIKYHLYAPENIREMPATT